MFVGYLPSNGRSRHRKEPVVASCMIQPSPVHLILDGGRLLGVAAGRDGTLGTEAELIRTGSEHCPVGCAKGVAEMDLSACR